ncbi:homoserine kinase [Virgibacillus sp. NKC19-16]|uniref:homoserine kinase n=1 Tax=Virgibacillus salidurans TaxID=2831673 RepID=UPI001F3808EF|nr:homoserine kinase [Virgibacillus sp. NKC19-16]UJL46791.1 homoserine kinase [Virgibacillus sp. NKC19-16]
MKNFTITVPASSANLGPAFDSAGIALNLYLTLEVTEAEQWELETRSHFLPATTYVEDNLIYQVAEQTAKRHDKVLPACNIIVTSDIPLARGFGSSASAVIAGIELANQVCDLSLSQEEKLLYGTEWEGHPDNIAPALLGGCTVTAELSENEVDWMKIPELDVDIVGYIPNFELKTEAARKALPEHFSRESAITASSISNLLIASLLSGDYERAGKMMEADLFHEPYRSELIPRYHEIKEEAKVYGAYGTVISGAGPTMVSFAPRGEGKAIAKHMQTLLEGYQVTALEMDRNGLEVLSSEKTAAE